MLFPCPPLRKVCDNASLHTLLATIFSINGLIELVVDRGNGVMSVQNFISFARFKPGPPQYTPQTLAITICTQRRYQCCQTIQIEH